MQGHTQCDGGADHTSGGKIVISTFSVFQAKNIFLTISKLPLNPCEKIAGIFLSKLKHLQTNKCHLALIRKTAMC